MNYPKQEILMRLPSSIYLTPTHLLMSNENPKMGNLKRSKDAVPRSRPDVKCKKHPKHRQSPGVCSLCLSEKLSQLSTSCGSRTTSSSNATDFVSSSSSSLSSYSSSSCSSLSSPMHQYYRYGREGKRSLSFLFNGKNVLLTKSRSLVSVTRTRGNKDRVNDENKKGGILSKLLRPINIKTD